eukprot:PhF_6_TR29362/c0_g1_i1/m.43202/K19674/WDR35, IFT121; WD repeat-containing protein 35
MFVYLSKKIAIPNNVKLRCIAWNSDQGWIACGGETGLLKVLKLEAPGAPGSKAGAGNNLSMNQTLDGHERAISVVAWNDHYHKLTSSDANGLIIVWMLHKGLWFEEMINNRNKSVVKDLCWTPDGSKICIVYEDGAVIVGSHDGTRLWGKELRKQLTHVAWSPDSRILLFGTLQGEVHTYDCTSGQSLAKVPIMCVDETAAIPLCGLHWYDGTEGVLEYSQPTLAIAYENGRCQIMRSEVDDKPILIDTALKATRLRWNIQGTVLAIGGVPVDLPAEKRDGAVVQFYSPQGVYLRTLKVPGSTIAGLAWEGNGLRLAMAVDSFIYFANIRPDYKWCYFSKTLVYAYNRIDRPEHVLVFWNVKSGEKNTKNVRKLQHIKGAGETCLVVSRADDSPLTQLALYNAIGSPVDVKIQDIEPQTAAMTATHIVITSDDTIYIWQYRPYVTGKKTDAINASEVAGKDGQPLIEKMFHVDDPLTGEKPQPPASDRICCTGLSDDYLFVARESGVISMYSVVDQIKLVNKIVVPCQPQRLVVNCNSTRFTVIDWNSVMSMYKVEKSTFFTTLHQAESANFERKDVWDVRWAMDNPEMFAIMEKTRMYIFRGMDPEEPVNSSAHMCSFKSLKIKAVSLDDILMDPEHPQKEYFVTFETKSLRDTRELLANVSMKDAFQFVEDNPHKKLWDIVAEYALEKSDYVIAEKCFVRCQDYQGIQFVKRLRMMDDPLKQRAEYLLYFGRFDEAEKVFKEMDRKDLAAEMRMRLGDWFKVVQLVQEGGGDDSLIQYAWEQIGDYYSERQKWTKAVQYYSQAKKYEKLVPLYFLMEDYRSLTRVIDFVDHDVPLLTDIGRKLASVGLSENAVEAFIKAGEIKLAVDACVELNQWDQAIQLAEKYRVPEISQYLSKYASHLVEKDRVGQAIELYKRAGRYVDSAKLLIQLAQRQTDPLRAKKLYVLSAIDVERFKRKQLDTTTRRTSQIVDGLLTAESATVLDKNLQNPWHGAEAFHFFMLCQKQLYDGLIDAAVITASRLPLYDDILDEVDLYSIMAVCSIYGKNFSLCSKAFVRLEAIENGGGKKADSGAPKELTSPKDLGGTTTVALEETLDLVKSHVAASLRAMTSFAGSGNSAMASNAFDILGSGPKKYQDLSVSIFSKYPPVDTSPSANVCPNRLKGDTKCGTAMKEWMSSCPSCGWSAPICVASGRTVFGKSVVCRTCKHHSIESELNKLRHCPLCHTPREGLREGGVPRS